MAIEPTAHVKPLGQIARLMSAASWLFEERDDAEAWCREMLHRRGLAPASRLPDWGGSFPE